MTSARHSHTFSTLTLTIAPLLLSGACSPRTPPICNEHQVYSEVTRGCVGLGEYMRQNDGAFPDGFDGTAEFDSGRLDVSDEQRTDSLSSPDVGCGDTQSNLNHCGACNTPCRAPDGGAARCVDGRCVTDCPMGSHACNGSCSRNDAPTSCGDRCIPCDAPIGATATCNAGVCGFVCPARTHLCGNACLSDDDPNSCGLRCTPCPGPAMPQCSAPLVDYVSISCVEGGLDSTDNQCLVGVICDMPRDAGRD